MKNEYEKILDFEATYCDMLLQLIGHLQGIKIQASNTKFVEEHCDRLISEIYEYLSVSK